MMLSLCCELDWRQAAMPEGGFVVSQSWKSTEDAESSPPPDDLLVDLTSRQNGRLTAWLDEHLLNLERDFKKRAFRTPESLVEKVNEVLTVILQTPPSQSYASQRIAYMLSLSSSIPRYITTLPYNPTTSGILLPMLAKVDRGWQCILRGDIWVNDKKMARFPGIPGRMDTTEQIRLKSIILVGRQQLEDWSFKEGETIEIDALSFGNGALQLLAEIQEEDEEDLDMI